MLHPLIASLSTETAAFCSFWLLRRQRVCFWMHSDAHFCFSSLSSSPSSASPSFVVARRGLSFAHFCFSRRCLPFSRLLHLPIAVVGFLVILLFHHRPLICSLHSFSLSPSLACHSLTSASHRRCRLVVILRVT